jgi:hypothetical protein
MEEVRIWWKSLKVSSSNSQLRRLKASLNITLVKSETTRASFRLSQRMPSVWGVLRIPHTVQGITQTWS